MKYTSPPQSADELINVLLKKGMVIDDIPFAKNRILNIGYFRLTRFMEQFLIVGDKGIKTFISGTSFQEVIDVYLFDSQLRAIVFEAIAHIEVGVRSILNYEITLTYGTHWYLNSSLFKEKFTTSEKNVESEYDKFIAKITKDCKDSRENYITQHRRNYDETPLPPSWVIMEMISFGTCGKLYENILDPTIKGKVAQFFNSNQEIFQTWLHAISFTRNACAHHQKLIYKKVKFPPIIPHRKQYVFLASHNDIEPDSIYSVLCIIQYCLKKLEIHSLFRECIIDLIQYNPQIMLSNIGFTDNWLEENIWQE